MRHNKIDTIISHLNLGDISGFYDLLYKKYKDEMMSSVEIHEYIKQNMPTYFEYSVRNLQRHIKKMLSDRGEQPRSQSQSFKLAIKKGRMTHEHQRKIHKIKRKSITPQKRYSILNRDDFKCVLCGNTADKTILEVDHIIPVCRGGKSTPDNLRTLCYECNIGKKIIEKER